MRKSAYLLGALISLGFTTTAQNFQQSWQGTLSVMGQELPLVFHVTKHNDGYETKMDSPKQGANGIPIEKTTVKGDSIFILASNMGLSYSGQLSADSIIGKFNQGGMSLPLHLGAVKDGNVASLQRPQTPKGPFDYQIDSTVTFSSQNGAYQLGGTLCIPKEVKAVAILISGSGQQDRDESIMGHKPFAVIADYLAQHGIATLRYDDRGVGASGGDGAKGTSLDNAYDAIGALNYIKSNARFANIPVGFIGHSEGGLIAFLAADQTKQSLDFIVSMAGPSVSGDTILTSQKNHMMEAAKVDKKLINFNNALDKYLYQLIRSTDNYNATDFRVKASKLIHKHYNKASEDIKATLGDISDLENQLNEIWDNEWLTYFMKTSPAPYIAKYNGRMLIMNGMKDAQVLANINIPAFKKILKNNPKVKYWTHGNLNHLFQNSDTGLPNEYGTIEQTIDTEALKTMSNFILNK